MLPDLRVGTVPRPFDFEASCLCKVRVVSSSIFLSPVLPIDSWLAVQVCAAHLDCVPGAPQGESAPHFGLCRNRAATGSIRPPMTPLPDEELAERAAQAGDNECFAELFARYRKKVFYAGRGFFPDSQAADAAKQLAV